MLVDVRGKRVLIFGDSMSHRGSDAAPDAVDVTETSTTRTGSPGDLFASYLLNAGAASVRINAKVGRSAYSFFRAEPGDQILADEVKRRPDIVFVILGTNDLGRTLSTDTAAMAKIRQAFADAGADVWCVGPPSFANSVRLSNGKTFNEAALAVVEMEKQVFGANHFIDARPMTADIITAAQGRTSSLVHFQTSGAQTWAARLANLVVGSAVRPDEIWPYSDMPSEITPPVPHNRGWRIGLAGITLGAAAILIGYIIARRNKLAS